MACGIALKRPLELTDPYDPYHSPEHSAKRPRTTSSHCSPFRAPFLASLASVAPSPSAAATAGNNSSSTSPFGAVTRSPLSRKQLESYLHAEIRSLRKRKLLPKHQGGKETYRAPRSPGNSSDSDGDQPCSSSTSAFASHNRLSPEEKPQFTFKQVRMICERLLKEQEEQLRGQYEAVLSNKLDEQYGQFVKFTQDQIHRQSAAQDDSALSYLS